MHTSSYIYIYIYIYIYPQYFFNITQYIANEIGILDFFNITDDSSSFKIGGNVSQKSGRSVSLSLLALI